MFRFPFTNFHELNLDWVIATVKNGEKEIADFIGVNTIKYANPILWNIESQYEANTVVVDGQTGNAYISVKAVPSGVHLNRTEYWTQIYNYANVIDTLREQIAPDNEGTKTTASKDREAGDLVWLNSKLVVITKDILAGTEYVEKTDEIGIRGNFKYTNIEKETRPSYNSDTQVLTIHGWVDGHAQIITRGDTHVFDGSTETMSIMEVR